MSRVRVVGGGMAGSEAAMQLARLGHQVELVEMRPGVSTAAHHTGDLGEIVCSNSFGATELTTPAGVLKAEMRQLGSLLLEVADTCRLPAGAALAVDRLGFARTVTQRLEAEPGVHIVRDEVHEVAPAPVIVATGPLTGSDLAQDILQRFGPLLSFHDAAAPIVTRESLDLQVLFRADRYGRGHGDYLNAAMDPPTYDAFWEALVGAEVTPGHDFEDVRVFEGCMPVEVMAARGRDTLRFGPLRPVGIVDPRTEHRPHAVVQLRQDDAQGQLFNLVGFQTRLRWGEQRRVFRMIPGLEQAEFVRYGVMHRNTFVNSPLLLTETLECRRQPGLFFAGQLVGVEGYMESAATGILAARNLDRRLRGLEPEVPPADTMLGALVRYVAQADPNHFQPMNANFGLLPPLEHPPADRRQRKLIMAQRAVKAMERFMAPLP